MQRRATRINKAILCRRMKSWFTTADIDEDANIPMIASQTSAILSEMATQGVAEKKKLPGVKAAQWRKLHGADEYLKRRIAKSRPASLSEQMEEATAWINIIKARSRSAA